MTMERGQSLTEIPARLSEKRRQRNSTEQRINDLEWQIWFARNHIFGSVERRKDDTNILVDYRDRAIKELEGLRSN